MAEEVTGCAKELKTTERIFCTIDSAIVTTEVTQNFLELFSEQNL